MPRCNFNKVAKELSLNHTLTGVFSCKFAAFFRTHFPKDTSGGLLLDFDFNFDTMQSHSLHAILFNVNISSFYK